MRRRFAAQPPTTHEVSAAYDAAYQQSPLRDSDRFYRDVARRLAGGLATGSFRGARVLDVGCGGGYLLRSLHTTCAAEVKLHGLEISRTALEEARRQVPEACFTLGQGERLPYPDGTFDVVACLGNLEHFIDPAAGARELARVCRRTGEVWLLLPNGFYSGVIWKVIRTGYGPNHHQIIDRFATVNEWRDFLQSEGLTVEAVSPYNRYKWWKRLLPRNLAWHFLYQARPT